VWSARRRFVGVDGRSPPKPIRCRRTDHEEIGGGIGFQHRACFVETGHSDLREDFPDMNQMTREGNNWRNFREASDLSAMEFSIGPSDCWAIEKRGPQWGGGHVWVIHASFCRADRHPADPADLDRVLGSLQVRQYESSGNLRAAPQ
jgi:hypothetical protein